MCLVVLDTVDDGMKYHPSHITTFSEGYTVQKAIGRWQGVNEDTFLLTVITDELKTLQSLCQTYKDLFNQESVLIQELPTTPIFI